MSVEALEAKIPFQFGRRRKVRPPIPSPEPIVALDYSLRPDVEVIVIGNQTSELKAQAREAGAEIVRGWYTSTAEEQKRLRETETGKNKRGKGRISHFFNKALLHTVEESHRQKRTREAATILHREHNLQTVVEAPRIRRSITEINAESTRAEHEANQDAKTKQIETQVREGINLGGQILEDTVIKLDKDTSQLYADLLANVITPIVNGRVMNRQAVENAVIEIVNRHESDSVVQRIFGQDGWASDYRMVATNLIARAEALSVHADEYNDPTLERTLEDDVEIVFADMKSGARTEMSQSLTDRLVNFTQTKFKGILNPASVATSLSLAILASQRGVGNILRATETIPEVFNSGVPLYLSIPAAIAGVVAGVRHRREENIDMELHARQDAKGEEISTAATPRQQKRREKLQTYTQHDGTTVEALLTGEGRDGGSLEELRRDLDIYGSETYEHIIDRLGEIFAVRNLSDRQNSKKGNVDTIRATESLSLDQGDARLTEEIAKTLNVLRIHAFDEDLKNDLTKNIKNWEATLQEDIDEKQSKFAWRARARSIGVGAIATTSAIAIGTTMRYAIAALPVAWEWTQTQLQQLRLPENAKSTSHAAASPDPVEPKPTEREPITKMVEKPGEPINIAHNTWAAGHTTTVEDAWYDNKTPGKSNLNEIEAHNKRVGKQAVRWDIKDMTNHGSFANDITPTHARVKELIKQDAIYYRLWDPDIPADKPGGLNNPIIVKSNIAGGGLQLDQRAGKTKMVSVWKNRFLTQVPENQLAKYTFSSDLGGFKANSDFSNFEDKFHVKVSPGTLRMVNGEYVFQSFATIDGDGNGEAIQVPTVIKEEVPVPQPPTEEPPVNPKDTVTPPPPIHPEFTLADVKVPDFGLPLPISPRLAPGPMVRSRAITTAVSPAPTALPGFPGPLPEIPPAIPPASSPAVVRAPVNPTGFVLYGARKHDGPQPAPVILKPNSPEKKLSLQELRALSDDDFLKLLNGLVMIDANGLERYLQQNKVVIEDGARYYYIIDHKGMTERFTLDELRALYLRGDIRLEAKK